MRKILLVTSIYISIFMFSIAIAYIFAKKYYSIYIEDKNSFYFSSEIIEYRKEEHKKEKEKWEEQKSYNLLYIEKMQKEFQDKIDVLNYFLDEIENNAFEITVINFNENDQIWKEGRIWKAKQEATIKTEKYLYSFRLSEMDLPEGGTEPSVSLRVYDKEGNSLEDSTLEARIHSPEYRRAVGASLPYVELKKQYFEQRLPQKNIYPYKDSVIRGIREIQTETVKKYERDYRYVLNSEFRLHPWSFFDFFYFSVITLTTVGYGDILPNSTYVRKWVVLEVLAGYGLIIVVLNVIAFQISSIVSATKLD